MPQMNSMILQLMLGLIEEAPTLFEDGRTLFEDIAHGQGGLKKLTTAAAAFAALAGHASNAASMVAGATAQAPTPKPANIETASLGGDTETARQVIDTTYSDTAPPPVLSPDTPAPSTPTPPGVPVPPPAPPRVETPAAPPAPVPAPAQPPVDATGNPILNAADAAAKAAQESKS